MPRFIELKKDAKPAKVVGELAKSADPAVSEWGNPVMRSHDDSVF